MQANPLQSVIRHSSSGESCGKKINIAVRGDFPVQTIDDHKLPAGINVDHIRVYTISGGGGKVALKSQGQYVSSENGVSPITCNRSRVDDWERFDWIVNTDGAILSRRNNRRLFRAKTVRRQ